jgi:malonate-semialdehyde dehydrogenase (acetylating)/methylmalonate-semialdehyde dehydrogenase
MKYKPVQNYIKGEFANSTTSRKLDVISPLDGNKLSEVPMSSSVDLDEAVRAAKAVFPHWSKTPIKERVQVFFKFKIMLRGKWKNNW